MLRGDELGSLHGLPIGIKDLALTEGLRTTFGSPQFADHVPEADERQVAAVRKAGAIVVGKTNTPEFGAGANTVNPVYGATGNPFDPGKTCAGSSGGSAVALATGMVPLATGSVLAGGQHEALACAVRAVRRRDRQLTGRERARHQLGLLLAVRLVEDRRCHTAQPDRMLLVVEGVTLLSNLLQFRVQRCRAIDSVIGIARQPALLQDSCYLLLRHAGEQGFTHARRVDR